MSLGSVSIDLAANVARLQQDMDKARGVVERGFKGMESAAGAVKSVLGAALGGLAVGGLTGFIKQSIDAADNLRDLANRFGTTTEQIGALQYAASLSGVELEGLAGSFGKMQKALAQAENGERAQAEAFDRLGLSVAALQKMSPEEQFLAIGDAISRIENPAQRTAAAMDIFGKSGAAVNQVFRDGAPAIREALADYRELSGVTDEFADNADAANDALAKMQLAFGGLGNAIASVAAPALEAFAKRALQTIGVVQQQLQMAFGTGIGAELTRAQSQLGILRKQQEEPGVLDRMFGDPQDLQRRIEAQQYAVDQLTRQKAEMEQAAAPPPMPQIDLDLVGTNVRARGGRSSGMKEHNQRIQDEIQSLEAQFSQFRQSLDAERDIMEASQQVELERAGDNAAAKLEIEKRYQDNARVLKEQELQAEIAMKRKIDALNQDRGDSARIVADINGLEQQLIATREVSAKQAELLGLREASAARQRRQELQSVFDVLAEQRAQMAVDELDPAKAAAMREQLLQGTESGRRLEFERSNQAARDAYEQQKISVEELNQVLARNQNLMEDTKGSGNQLGMIFESAFEDAIVSGRKFGDVMRAILADLSKMLIRETITAPIGNWISKQASGFDFGSLLSGAGSLLGFASGGRPPPGRMALVGEQGPELWVPDSAGTVVPLRPAGRGGPGGGTVVNVIDQRSANAAPIETRRDRDPNGNERITVMVRDEVKKLFNSGYMDKTMRSNFGVGRSGTVR